MSPGIDPGLETLAGCAHRALCFKRWCPDSPKSYKEAVWSLGLVFLALELRNFSYLCWDFCRSHLEGLVVSKGKLEVSVRFCVNFSTPVSCVYLTMDICIGLTLEYVSDIVGSCIEHLRAQHENWLLIPRSCSVRCLSCGALGKSYCKLCAQFSVCPLLVTVVGHEEFWWRICYLRDQAWGTFAGVAEPLRGLWWVHWLAVWCMGQAQHAGRSMQSPLWASEYGVSVFLMSGWGSVLGHGDLMLGFHSPAYRQPCALQHRCADLCPSYSL